MEVILVPRSPTSPSTLEKLCTRFRTARLRALRDDPNAFFSSYEKEIQFEPREWVNRLQSPEARMFVAICPAASETETETETSESLSEDAEKLAENEWLGMIVLIGPRALSPADSLTPWKPFTTGQKDDPASTTRTFADQDITYFAASMFVLHEMRRRGLGRKLIEMSIDSVRHEAASLRVTKSTIGLALEAENKAAMELYQKCGFELLPHDPSLKELTARGQETAGMARVLHLSAEQPSS